jgi:hypothetical protein
LLVGEGAIDACLTESTLRCFRGLFLIDVDGPGFVVGQMVQRLRSSKLVHGAALKDEPNISALQEFLVHGLKYAFPAEHGEVTRGVATSYAAEPLKSEISGSNDLPPVWPWRDGETRGVGLQPLYKKVPHAALRDPVLYQFLALVDAIRDGHARERGIAERDLVDRLKAVHGHGQL